MTVISIVLAKCALVLFGLPIACTPALRPFGFGARLAAAYGCGAIVLTLHALLLSALHLPWSAAVLSVPLLLGSALLSWVYARRPAETRNPRESDPSRGCIVGWIAIAAAWMHWTLAVVSARATSADYLYFWGAKAVRFARAGGIDAALLADPFMLHLRPPYPPLVPVMYVWNIVVSGEMHWRLTMLDSAIWLIAGSLLLHALLRERLDASAAIQVTAFWTAAMALSFEASYSGGNAEAALVYFASIAAAALYSGGAHGRLLAPLALAGCMLTKAEGTLIGAALIGTAVLARLFARRRVVTQDLVLAGALPLLALMAWYGFELASGLPLRDPLRSGVLKLDFAKAPLVAKAMIRNLDAGTWGMSWFVPIAVAAVSFRRWRNGLGPLLASAGLLTFYWVYYLHEQRPLDMVISWEIPRISQPPLALMIIGAGLASADWRARTAPERSHSLSS